jgi:outer membrane receptor for ferrienterochelin and colicins
MRLLLLLLLLLLLSIAIQPLTAQTVNGRVLNQNGEPLPGATITWLQTGKGTQTDAEGLFSLQAEGLTDKRFAASFVGFKPDTASAGGIFFYEIVLAPQYLDAVEVSARKPGIYISILQPIKTEVITQAELKKAACCDLAGCFETQGTVQPQTTNVLTNSRELRILGLSGVYNQLLVEGMPLIQGATYTYGISSIPGVMVDNIFVAKGANSVLQGFESISGQINVELKAPEKTDPLQINAYINTFGERHFNAAAAVPLGKNQKWHSLTALHVVQPAGKIDGDGDSFLDLPRLTRYAVFQKFTQGNAQETGWSTQTGFRYVAEDRTGGQTFFDPETDLGTTRAYGQTVRIRQPEWYAKTGYRFNERNRIAFSASAFHHDQESWFGITRYTAAQTNLYANLQYEYNWGKAHDLKAGLSYRYQNLNESILFTDNTLQRTFDGDYRRQDRIPGIFAENIFAFDRIKIIAGLRADKHPDFQPAITPRILFRYDMGEHTILRASAGRGWRMVNLFAENIGLLAGSRDVVFEENLLPERAWNAGFNLIHNLDKGILQGYLSADLYHTRFQNQFFPDYDTRPDLAIIRNFTGVSISNGVQAEAVLRFWETTEAKISYNFLDVYRIENGDKNVLPFNPAHKLLLAGSYEPKSRAWHFDANMHWYGAQRLPFTGNNPADFRAPEQSPAFALLNAQFTKVWSGLEVYIGVENVFNFRQLQPLLNWQNPFDRYFDTAFVWGPVRGREGYLGLRWRWKKQRSD